MMGRVSHYGMVESWCFQGDWSMWLSGDAALKISAQTTWEVVCKRCNFAPDNHMRVHGRDTLSLWTQLP